MKLYSLLLFFSQAAVVLYGLYIELAPADFPKNLPPGMGLSLALIGATMSLVLLYAEREREQRQKQMDDGALFRQISNGLSACLTVHEREFYAIWPEQVRRATNNVDITHLGLLPPRVKNSPAESDYFSDLKKIYKSSRATIRRVERYSSGKKDWINKLAKEFEGVANVSLAVYQDPFDTPMPAAMSVCRIDDRYAWLIAVAEHESTGNVRDLMLTGKESVDLVRRYFQERLWSNGIVVLDRGKLCVDWEKRLKP
ncbi:hypothetical protein [Zoogloea sp.]|uniref:hypothetical protein n=1 Tax=Zoogloea sp. TaxID=49181 RepID=UPI0014157E59|nr:MAG: hypothetical protein F9K15_13440 [Zoogloea sp.]